MTVHVVLLYVANDGKSADMVACRYGGKNTKRLTAGCGCSFQHSADALHDCKWVKMSDLQELYKKATSEGLSPVERQRYVRALHELSTHLCDSAFYDVFFGANKFGICLAAPCDMMHLFELGILGYCIDIFVATMTPTMRVEVDSLIDKLFGKLRSSEKGEHHRMNFTGGATSLSLLRACEWPGLVQAILVMLLTAEGRAICTNCFTKEGVDVDIPSGRSDYPTFSNAALVPNIPAAQPPRKRKSKADTLSAEETKQDADKDTNDDADAAARSNSEDEDEVGASAKAAKDSGAARKLPCSYSQFVDLLESLLVFHSWYKDGGQVKATTTTSQKRTMAIKIRRLMMLIQQLLPRIIGNKWQIQKFHQLLHIIFQAEAFGDIRNWDVGIGEKHLGFRVKIPVRTAQKMGAATFTRQIAERLHFGMVLMKALQTDEGLYERALGVAHWSSLGKDDQDSSSSSSDDDWDSNSKYPPVVDQVDQRDHIEAVGNPSITIKRVRREDSLKDLVMADFRTTSAHHTEVHPSIVDWFAHNWDTACGEDHYELKLWTELRKFDKDRKKVILYRAHPNLRGDGHWYNFAYVGFETERKQTTNLDYFPCRILAFYVHPIKGALHALVHPCGHRDEFGTITERQQKKLETKLCHRWTFEYKKRRVLLDDGWGGVPALHTSLDVPRLTSVPCHTLYSRLLVIPESSEVPTSHVAGRSKHCWVVDSRFDRGWSKHF
jgi:hypothetical protein